MMPRLIQHYIRQVAAGFGLSVIFVAGLLALDVAHLRHLILDTSGGWLAGALLVLFNGLVFAGAQFAVSILLMSDQGRQDGSGRRQGRDPAASPNLVPVAVDARRPR